MPIQLLFLLLEADLNCVIRVTSKVNMLIINVMNKMCFYLILEIKFPWGSPIRKRLIVQICKNTKIKQRKLFLGRRLLGT